MLAAWPMLVDYRVNVPWRLMVRVQPSFAYRLAKQNGKLSVVFFLPHHCEVRSIGAFVLNEISKISTFARSDLMLFTGLNVIIHFLLSKKTHGPIFHLIVFCPIARNCRIVR